MKRMVIDSPVGALTLVGDTAIAGLWFDGRCPAWAAALEQGDFPAFQAAESWLHLYFTGMDPGPTPLLLPAGTPFRQRVWAQLRQIPWGQSRTYGQLAAAVGMPGRGAQAVGQAVGHNPIAILIPCHRVLGADGRLTGFAGGLACKERLLTLEGIVWTPEKEA